MLMTKRNDILAAFADMLGYIRTHLDQPLDLATLSDRAGFSPYHFHRIFRAAVGETPAAYIRRKRLQRAAAQLRETDRDITALAVEWGYETPSAFTRAFTEHFGMPPTDFRAHDDVAIVPEHVLSTFGEDAMNAEVRDIPSARLLARHNVGSYRTSAPAAWAALLEIAGPRGLIQADTQLIGLSYGSPEIAEETDLHYDACITSNAAPVSGLHAIDFPGGRYAIFRHTGTYDLIEHAFERLFDAAIFSGTYALREAPCVEIYLNDPRNTPPAELMTDVGIPVL
jgi:AraC family transcriptional regulator